MPQLFISNVPGDCQESELRQWVESKGFPVNSIHIIRDVVSGVSPAFVYLSLRDSRQISGAIRILHGQNLKGLVLRVQEDWRNRQNKRRAGAA